MRPPARKTFAQVDAAYMDLFDQVHRGVIEPKEFKAKVHKMLADSGWEVQEFKETMKGRRTKGMFSVPTLPNAGNGNIDIAPSKYQNKFVGSGGRLM